MLWAAVRMREDARVTGEIGFECRGIVMLPDRVPRPVRIGEPSKHTVSRPKAFLTGLSMISAATTFLGCGPDPLPPYELALTNVHVVSLTGSEPRDLQTVFILGDTIVALEPVADHTLEDAPNVIDGEGRYVLPGLVDPHVHVREARELKLYLAAGITTVRNMNGRFGTALAWRDSLANGTLIGPRFVTSSPTLFDGAPGYEFHVDGPQRARELARQFSEEGYDLIKVYQLSEPSVRALMDEAATLGIPVAGHIPLPTSDLEAVLELGFVSLEHLDEFVGPGFGGLTDYSRIPEVADRIAAADVTIGTILSQWRAVNRSLDDPDWLLADSLMERATFYFGDEGPVQLRDMAEDMRVRTEEDRNRDRSDFDFLFALLRALDERGVNIVASTDAHQVLAPAGEGLWNEMEILVEAGLSEAAALRAVTRNAARALSREGRAGSVAVGMEADLVVVEQDPLQDLGALRRPWGVAVQGAWLDRAQLDELLRQGRGGGR
jgi:imidazolonepropionase-like amidohydrolase